MKKIIHFEIVSRYRKDREPATTAVPFGQGELKPEEIRFLTVSDGKKQCQAQLKATALWGDGSVKWLLVHFLADLPENRETDFYLELSTGGIEAVQENTVRVLQEGENTILDNGAVRVELAAPKSCYMFERIVTPDHIYGRNEITGPVLTDKEGREYVIELDNEGWEIIESGPVRAMVRARGKHRREDRKWFDFSLILTLWAGKPWMNLDYQFINCEDDPDAPARKQMVLNNEQAGLKYDKDYPYEEIRSIRLSIHPSGEKQGVRHGIYTSSFNFHSEKATEKETLSEVITADTV